jgi:hypothetical protein
VANAKKEKGTKELYVEPRRDGMRPRGCAIRVARNGIALAAVGVIATVVPLAAQSAPDLSGTWVLNVAKSQMEGPPVRADRSVVTRVGNTYHIVSMVDAGTGPITDSLIVPVSDGETTNVVRGVQLHSFLAYKGDTNVTTTDFKMNGQIVAKNTSRAWISTDRRTMTKVADYHPVGGAPIHDVMVYDKE